MDKYDDDNAQNDYSSHFQNEYVLPRLNIAVYSVGNHLADIAGQIMLDRRFINSKISIFGGGINAAINYYKDNITPDTLIIEIDSDLNTMMDELFQLSDVCDANTRVVVAGKMNDVDLYKELIRNGISEYLVLPTTPTGLISVINTVYQDKAAAPMSPAIAFIGAMGGVGTSIIAQSVALSISNSYNIDTIFVDLDAAYPMTSLSWSAENSKNIGSLISASHGHVDDAMLKSCLVKISNNLSLLTTPSDPILDWDFKHKNLFEESIKVARQLSDYTIIDIPSGYLSVEKQAALLNVSDVFIIAEPTIKGIRNLSILYDAIMKLRPNDPAPKVILNKLDIPDATHLDDKMIKDNTGIAPTATIRYLPEVLDLAIARAVPVSTMFGSTPFNDDIQNCINIILGKASYSENNKSVVNKLLSNVRRAIGL